MSLREKCPSTKFFLVRIFLYLDWIVEYLSVFSPKTRKYGPEKSSYLDTFHVVCSFWDWMFHSWDVRSFVFENILQALRLKICERLEVVEWNKNGPLPSPAVLWVVSVCERKSWWKKKICGLQLFVNQVMNLELNLSIYSSRFDTWPKNQDKNFNILRTKRVFEVK